MMIQLADPVIAALQWSRHGMGAADELAASTAVRIGAISGLKTFPLVAQQVLSLLGRADFTIDEITDTIRKDPSLAAGVLKLANSPFYASTQPITSLDIAFIRLGRNAVREAIFAVATMQMFPDKNGLGKLIRDHCAGTAAICHTLSLTWRIGPPETMFLSGLLHDIGIMLCIDSREVEYNIGDDKLFSDVDILQRQEMEQLGFDHAIIGGQVLHRWKVGAPIPQLVAFHHIPPEAWKTPETANMLSLLRLADNIDFFAGNNHMPFDDFIDSLCQAPQFTPLELTENKIHHIWDDLIMSRSDARSLFSG